MGITDAFCIPFNPPPIQGLGNFGGFAFDLENTQRLPMNEFAEIANSFINEARKSPKLTGISTTFRANAPQIIVDVDREKAESIGVKTGDVFKTIQAS